MAFLARPYPEDLFFPRLPWPPTDHCILFGPLCLAIGHPGLEILLPGRRMHIRRYADIPPRRAATGAKERRIRDETDWKAEVMPGLARAEVFPFLVSAAFCMQRAKTNSS